MNLRRILLLLVALVAAGGTAMVARKFINSPQEASAKVQAEAVAPEPASEVLVAIKDLPAGRIIEKGDLKFRPWPQDGVIEGFVLRAPEADKAFIGAVVRRGITKGEPVTDARVVKPGERGFLAAIVEPGQRAISVPINATTGVAGLFFPGDQVDVILTHVVKQGKTERNASETVLRDVRVLAVDQRVEDIDGKAQVAKTATLEVTPKQAEVLTMLSNLGKLSLSLRSVARPEGGEESLEHAEEKVLAESYTLDSEVSAVLHRPPSGNKQPKVRVSVIRGGKKQASQSLSFGIVPLQGAAPGAEPEPGDIEGEDGSADYDDIDGIEDIDGAIDSGLEDFSDTTSQIVGGE
ncbi:MAG: Flp pilus assembly protein CpaB [Alphaproteobacteria bacterium]